MQDQTLGLLLAISSSAFIGSSFIVKKRGLRKAGASGTRAGASFPSSSFLSTFRLPPRLFPPSLSLLTPPLPRKQTHEQAPAATATCASPCGGRGC